MDEEKLWDISIMDSEGEIIFEDFDYETEKEAEDVAMAYIEENGIEDYLLDISQPDC